MIISPEITNISPVLRIISPEMTIISPEMTSISPVLRIISPKMAIISPAKQNIPPVINLYLLFNDWRYNLQEMTEIKNEGFCFWVQIVKENMVFTVFCGLFLNYFCSFCVGNA